MMSYQNIYNKIILVIAILLSTIFSAGFYMKEGKKVTNNYLNLKEIISPNNNKMVEGFEYGKKYFPEYSFWGLPETFLIKKKPDITFKPKQIKVIEIIRMPYIPQSVQNFQINIHFDESSSKALSAFTKKMINKKVALEVDGRVFEVGTIMEPIENGLMSFSILNKSFFELRELLSKITNKIVAININEAR